MSLYFGNCKNTLREYPQTCAARTEGHVPCLQLPFVIAKTYTSTLFFTIRLLMGDDDFLNASIY